MSASDEGIIKQLGYGELALKSSKRHEERQHTMHGRNKRGYRAPVKATLWNSKRWDKKCEAEFVDYVPPSNPRLL